MFLHVIKVIQCLHWVNYLCPRLFFMAAPLHQIETFFYILCITLYTFFQNSAWHIWYLWKPWNLTCMPAENAGVGIGKYTSLCTDPIPRNLLAVKWYPATLALLALTRVTYWKSSLLHRSMTVGYTGVALCCHSNYNLWENRYGKRKNGKNWKAVRRMNHYAQVTGI